MARQSKRSSNALLASRAIELSVAVPQVVAHRVGRMLSAGAAPSAADRTEFMNMGTEKVQAFSQSWTAMWMTSLAIQGETIRAMTRLPGAGAFGSAGLQKVLLGNPWLAAARVMNAGLKPVHAKAVSNSKRLARKAK